MMWMFGLQLFVSGFFHKWPTFLVGIVPVVLTAALGAWTIYKVVQDARIKIVQDNRTVAKDAPRQTDMILQSPNDDSRGMAIDEFNSLYEPTHEQVKDPLLANKGFRAYRSTTQVWAHQLTADDVLADFPKRRFISSSGAPTSVQSGQYIAMPFPQGDDAFIVDAEKFEAEYLSSTEEKSTCRAVLQAEMLRKWDVMLRREESIYAKSTKVHAKHMREEGMIDTVVNGEIEARCSYEKGDYIVCGSRGGRYPMQEHQFPSRYNTSHSDPATDPLLASVGFNLYKAKGKVRLRSLRVRPTVCGVDSPRFWQGMESKADAQRGC